MQLAHNNRVLAPDVDTVFFMTSLEHGYVSSSLVKEIALFGGDVSAMVPAAAAAALPTRRSGAADAGAPRADTRCQPDAPPSRSPAWRALRSTSSSSSSASSR